MYGRMVAGWMASFLFLVATGPLAEADTTSWDVNSVEWLVDASDAVFVADLVKTEKEVGQSDRRLHTLKIVDTLKEHASVPADNWVLVDNNRHEPGDVLIVFWANGEALQVINTSRPTELIHFENIARDNPRKYAFLAMNALGKVLETREQLEEQIKQRVEEKVVPLGAEILRRIPQTRQTRNGYWCHDPDLYESHGYDVIISLLIPLDRADGTGRP